MKITELYGIVTLNVSQFEAGLVSAEKKTRAFRENFVKTAGDVATAAERITLAVVGTATAVAAVTTKMGFSFLQSRDSAEIMLSTILKNGPLAKKTLAELFEAAKKTPFSFEGLKDGLVQLANAKVPADQLIPSLYKISDGIAAVGGNDEAIKGVTMALSQMMSSGRLNAGDMLQLTNRGIAGWDMLAERMGSTVAEVRKLSESGAIDGRMAAQLIIDEMGKRFAGAGDQLSQKFQGLWSSFMDTAQANAGRIVEPLYDAVGRMLGRLNQAVDSGGAGGFIGRLRNMVAELAQQIEQLAVTNGPQILEAIVRGFENLGRVGVSVLRYLQEQGPALMESAQGWWELLQPIIEFLAKHPELVVALMFFKGGQMLGINQAVMSLAMLMTSLTGSVIGLTAALPALGVALGVGLGVYLAQTNKDMKDLHAALEKTKQLTEQMTQKRQTDQNKVIAGARDWFATGNKGDAVNFVKEQLAQARRSAAGADQSVLGAQANLAAEKEKTTLLDWAGGDKMVVAAQNELEETKARAAEAKAFVHALEQELQRFTQMMQAGAPAAGAGPGAAAAPGMNVADLMAKKEAEKQAKQDEKDAAKQDKRDEAGIARRLQESQRALGDFGEQLFQLESQIPDERIATFTQYLEQLTQKYQEGKISQDEFRQGLDTLSNSMRVATQAAQAQATFEDQFKQTQGDLQKAGVSEGPMGAFNAQAEGFRQQLAQLALRFQNGQMNAFEFRQETEKLTDAMNAAAAAAKQEEAAERRKMMIRVLGGQGTEEDFAKIQAMQQAQMMQNFDQALTGTFNAMFGLGEAAQQVQQGFADMTAGMQQFGQQMGAVGGGMGGNGVTPGQAYAQISQMLNSVQGQLANGYNQIQLLQQSLYYIQDPRRRAEVTRQIESIQNQMAALQRPQAPLFTGMTNETSGGRMGTTVVKQDFSFPNWSPENAYQIAQLADAVANEIVRRGGRAF